MSDTLGPHGRITITQVQTEPCISIAPGMPAAPMELPAFPLSTDPFERWELRIVNGSLEWVHVMPSEADCASDLLLVL